ncbi:MAG: dihydrofolate reductase [Myxococcales bacterium]|nr:dihydrofolate reductase [Myxococcales bacterium]
MKVSVFIATSVDGYIARKGGEIDWLEQANQLVPEGEDCGYQDFMEGIDLLVMGRKTFEQVLSFGMWPYAKPVLVLSREKREVPEDLIGKVSFSSEEPGELYERLVAEGTRRIYIDGGYTIQQFLGEGLVTDLVITKIPILLGGGISLFGALECDIRLRHVWTKAYDFGFVQSKYELVSAVDPDDAI